MSLSPTADWHSTIRKPNGLKHRRWRSIINHPGMRGIFLLLEATRQLRGESSSQSRRCVTGSAHGNGGQLAAYTPVPPLSWRGLVMSNRPQPLFPEPNSEPFWEGVKAGELRYQTCNDCNTLVFNPREHCPNCLSNNLKWNLFERGRRGLHLLYCETEPSTWLCRDGCLLRCLHRPGRRFQNVEHRRRRSESAHRHPRRPAGRDQL